MSQVSKKLRKWSCDTGHGFSFFCPGCNSPHTVSTSAGGWGFNGDVVKPTFAPSVLVTHEAHPDAEEGFEKWRTARVCHSFVTDGMIQFLGGCTHALANQTVPLADWPETYQ